MADPVVGISAELLLLGEQFAKAFEKELNRSQDAAKRFESAVQREFDRINGTKATKQVELIGRAVERMGGLAKLSGQQVDNLRVRVEALAKAGARLPSSLASLGQTGPGIGAQLAGNIQTQGLGSLQSQIGPLGGLLTGLSGTALAAGAAIAGISAAAVGAATAVAAATVEFAEFSGHLTDLSAQTGIGTTALQELEFAGSFVGVGLDEITSAVGRMQKAIAEGDTVFQRLGLNLEELAALKPEEQFFKVAEAINQIQDPTRKAAAAIEVFGKSGPSLLPLFNDMVRLREEAHRLGVVFDQDAIKKGDQLGDAFNRLDKATEALGRAFGKLAGNAGLIKFLELLAKGVGEVSTNLPRLLDLLERLGPLLSGVPGGGLISTLAQASGLAGAASGLGGGGGGVDLAAATAAARAAIAATKFETAAEEAKRKKALEESERAAKKFAEALRQARVEAFELGLVIRDVGDEGMEALSSALFGASSSSLTLSSATQTLGVAFGSVTVSAEELNAAIARGEALAQAAARSTTGKAAADLRAAEAAAAHQLAMEQLASALSQIGGLFRMIAGEAGGATAAIANVGAAAADAGAAIVSGDLMGAFSAGWNLGEAIASLFDDSADKLREIAQQAGAALGLYISGAIAEAIQLDMTKFGIDAAAAGLLHISDVAKESGTSVVGLGSQVASLFAAVASGAVPAKEGIGELGELFSMVAEEAEAGSVSAMAMMGQMAAAARAIGKEIPEIAAAVAAAVADSTGALAGLGGIKLVDEADARAQAMILVNVFSGVLATEGIVAAAQAIQPALATFREQLADAGIGKAAADTILGPINSAMSLLKNDMTKGGAEGAQALKTILESQLKAGFLDTGTFAAIQQQAGSAFDQMIKGGANTGAALQAVAPLLAQIMQTAQATGAAIDPVTQGLIDQAKAAGIAFPVDTGTQMVTLLSQVVTLLGGIPETFSQIGASSSSSMSTLGSSTAAAASSASASLNTIATNAIETSSTVVAAFDGVGEQITSAITPVSASLSAEFAGVFAAATDQAAAFASFLGKLDDKTLTIPFKFEGGEGLGGGGAGIEGFQGGTRGKFVDFGKESLALLHGEEAIVPKTQATAGLFGSQQIQYAPQIVVNGSGLNREELVWAVDRALKNNEAGLATRVKQLAGGKD